MSQFDVDGPEEEPIEFAIHRANSVSTICSVIRFLREQQFQEKYMGSGFLVTFQKLDGELLCSQFLVPGEDMQAIKTPILEALVRSLTLKRALCRNNITEIDKTVTDAQKITLDWLVQMGGKYLHPLQELGAQVGFWDEKTKLYVLSYDGSTDKWFAIDGMPVPDRYAPKNRDGVRTWLAAFKLL